MSWRFDKEWYNGDNVNQAGYQQVVIYEVTMGITYIFSLGFSPGVVTSPLSWVNEHLKTIKGGIGTEEYDLAVQFFGDDAFHSNAVRRLDFDRIIILTTEQVLKGNSAKYCDNSFGTPALQAADECDVFETVWKFIEKNIKRADGRKPEILCGMVHLSDFMYNLRVGIEAIGYTAAQERGKGWHTWLNVTGATNIINTAMLNAAYLVGKVGRIYYTYVEGLNVRCLRPPVAITDNSFWFDLPPLRVAMIQELYEILAVMHTSESPLTANAMLTQLQKDNPNLFSQMSIGVLLNAYLNKLDPRYVKRNHDNTNELTNSGKDLLEALQKVQVGSSITRPSWLVPMSKLEDRNTVLASALSISSGKLYHPNWAATGAQYICVPTMLLFE